MTRLHGILALLVLGLLWGLGAPLVRMARLDGVNAISVVLWQCVAGTMVMALIQALRGRIALPLDRASLQLYAVVALLGNVLPHLAGYVALGHIPAGVHALLTSLVPMFALTLGLALRYERPEARRMIGLALGALAVALLLAPGARGALGYGAGYVLLSALAPFFYALEGAYVGQFSRARAGALQALMGGSALGAVLTLPLAALTGATVVPRLDPSFAAVIIAGIAGTLAYAGYVTLLRRAGPIFASQVAYVVTLTAIFWSWALLGERPSPAIWAALALLFAGLFLVQPRGRADR
jgi:drug/metabolite transporter (DMT)-like permease